MAENRRALLTGITGQDGSYLTGLLVGKEYEVHGVVRRHSEAESQTTRIEQFLDVITLHYGDVTDAASISEIVKKVQPDEVYNLAAMSQVRISSYVPVFTAMTNGVGALNVLEAVRTWVPEAKFYQAGSSEMFGQTMDPDGYQRLTTPMRPVSPYGAAKLFAFNMAQHYRAAYNMFVVNGVLFNHESPRRSIEFVTAKIVKRAVEIKLGLASRLTLGSLDVSRDWGHAADYIQAIHMMMEHHEARDWLVATGRTFSVRDLLNHVFGRLELKWSDYVEHDPALCRPIDPICLRGDASETCAVLGWHPLYTFESMLDEMIEHWECHFGQ
jgi:GDPmannose 4,6-dehydratase